MLVAEGTRYTQKRVMCQKEGEAFETCWVPNTVVTMDTDTLPDHRRARSVVFEKGSKLVWLPRRYFETVAIKNLAIPDDVWLIPDCCFENCVGLYSVSFGTHSRLYRISDRAFMGSCLGSRTPGKLGNHRGKWLRKLHALVLPRLRRVL
ncbi:MAG: leucine-rich repeat domain-containing protein [Holosporaceae bacterium]|nr:leucine-rich repeat domain-containing protein [Holosporaceae bacterium]